MDKSSYTFVTYNCKNVKRSIDTIKQLCQTSDIIALQETWLLPDEIEYLGFVRRVPQLWIRLRACCVVDRSVGLPYCGGMQFFIMCPYYGATIHA